MAQVRVLLRGNLCKENAKKFNKDRTYVNKTAIMKHSDIIFPIAFLLALVIYGLLFIAPVVEGDAIRNWCAKEGYVEADCEKLVLYRLGQFEALTQSP